MDYKDIINDIDQHGTTFEFVNPVDKIAKEIPEIQAALDDKYGKGAAIVEFEHNSRTNTKEINIYTPTRIVTIETEQQHITVVNRLADPASKDAIYSTHPDAVFVTDANEAELAIKKALSYAVENIKKEMENGEFKPISGRDVQLIKEHREQFMQETMNRVISFVDAYSKPSKTPPSKSENIANNVTDPQSPISKFFSGLLGNKDESAKSKEKPEQSTGLDR